MKRVYSLFLLCWTNYALSTSLAKLTSHVQTVLAGAQKITTTVAKTGIFDEIDNVIKTINSP